MAEMRIYAREIGILRNLLQNETNSIGGHIHCWGNAKLDLVKKCMDELKLLYVIVDCLLVDGSGKRLFTDAVQGLRQDFTIDDEDDEEENCSINRFKKFSEELTDFARRKKKAQIVMVLDRVEYLRAFSPQFLFALCRLPREMEFLKLVTIGKGSWLEFLNKIPTNIDDLSNPIVIPFRSLNKEETMEMILTNWNSAKYSFSARKLEQFITMMLKMAFPLCRDHSRLLRMAEKIVSMHPEISSLNGDHAKFSDQNLRWLAEIINDCVQRTFCAIEGKWLKNSKQNSEDELNLPLHLKVLLIAAYCASYNPPKSDQRFFAKGHKKQKRSVARTVNENAGAHEIGPRIFDLQRLTFIFLALIDRLGYREEYGKRPICVQSQVGKPFLVSLEEINVAGFVRCGLLVRVSVAANLDECRLKCLASLDCVERIARSLSIHLKDYLFDFASK